MNRSCPILAAGLMLVPVLYVGSYLAMVRPAGIFDDEYFQDGFYWTDLHKTRYYAIIGNSGHRVYWPLEQIDRRVRPDAWDPFGMDRSRGQPGSPVPR